MDVKEAVAVAKGYLTQLYLGEDITHVGLEEVEFDEVSDQWSVTIGFARPWDQRSPLAHALSPAGRAAARSYKVLRIDDGTREVKSLKDRILIDAQ